MVISGNTTGSIKSTAIDIPCTIVSIALYNNTAGAIVAKTGIVVSGTDRYLFSDNLAAAGSAGSSVYHDVNIVVKAGGRILIVSSAGGLGLDYYITVK